MYSVATNAAGGDNGDPRYSMMKKAMAAQGKVMDAEGGTYNAAMACEQVIYQDTDPEMYSAEKDSSKHRQFAIAELADTETKYIGVLTVITKLYFDEINAHPTVFTDDDKKVLFANTFELLEIHTAFQKLLQRALSSTSGRVISPVFEQSLDCFTAYGEYCCRMMKAIDRYEELIAASSEAKQIFEDCQEKSGAGFPFRVMLNVPMQRILKYPLLLREIVRGTEKAEGNHKDAEGLDKAQAALGSLATLVNESMRHFENIEQLSNSLQKYDGKPLLEFFPFYRHAAQRVILKDDNLAYRGSNEKDKVAKRYCFLYPTAIFVCQPAKKGMYDYKDVVELTAGTLVQVASPMPKKSTTGKFTFGLTITIGDAVYTLAAKAEKMADQWAKAVQHNVNLIKENETRPPPKIPEPEPEPEPEPQTSAAAPSPEAESAYSQVNKPKKSSAGSTDGAADAAAKPRAAGGGAPRPKKKAAAPAKLKLAESGLSDSFAFFAWFAGKMDKTQAETALGGKPDGTYLVRESASRAGTFTLAIMSLGICNHIALKRPAGGGATAVTLGGRGAEFDSIPDMIMHHQEHDVGGNCPTKMLFPYKTEQ